MKNGRIDHSNGGHDDTVIAWLLGYWFLSNTKNSKFYGLEHRNILSDVNRDNPEAVKTLEEQRLINKQNEIKDNISELMKLLEKTNDNIQTILITNKIKYLTKYLDTDSVTSLNINARLEEARLLKAKKKKAYRW
jgi:hypothetical protein